MYRGTTPNIVLKMNSILDLSAMTQIWVTIKGWNAEKTYDLSDITVDAENNTLSFVMSQEDTLAFSACKKNSTVKIQVRLLDGQNWSYASDIADIPLSDILKDGEIE